MRLVWAQYALDDRETIFSYIERENPRAAARHSQVTATLNDDARSQGLAHLTFARSTRRNHKRAGKPKGLLTRGSYGAHRTATGNSRAIGAV
jgi:plasmid stabilization system protein ParE